MTPPPGRRIKDEMRGLLAERGLDRSVVRSGRFLPADPALNGLSMKQVAERLQASETADAQLEAARQMMLNGGAAMVYHFMSDADVDRIMRHPLVGIASDSGVLTPGEGSPHPRGYGNAVRVLGEYVRARKVIPLEEAIRKMTSLPAEHFQFAQRGLLKAGVRCGRRRVRSRDCPRHGDVRTSARLRGRRALRAGQRRPGRARWGAHRREGRAGVARERRPQAQPFRARQLELVRAYSSVSA